MPSNSQLAEIASDLIDDQVGIVRQAGVTPLEAGSPPFFHYWALAADTSAFSDQHNFAQGGGAADDRDRALAKAVGEAVERYCAAIYTKDALPLRPAAAAELATVTPETFALNSAAQYAEENYWLVPFDRETPARWTPAVDAITGDVSYVPAAMVHIPYFYEPGEPPIAQPISTGLACHASFE